MVPRSRLLPNSGPAPGKNDGALRTHHPVRSCLELMAGSRVTDGWDWRPAVCCRRRAAAASRLYFPARQALALSGWWGVKWRVSVSFFCRRRETGGSCSGAGSCPRNLTARFVSSTHGRIGEVGRKSRTRGAQFAVGLVACPDCTPSSYRGSPARPCTETDLDGVLAGDLTVCCRRAALEKTLRK